MSHIDSVVKMVSTAAELKKLKKMNRGTVRVVSGDAVIELSVHGIPESEANAISNACIKPVPPRKRRVVKNDKGLPMIDPQTKKTMFEEYDDAQDPTHIASVSKIDRAKNLMTVVSGLEMDWSGISDSGSPTLEDKMNFVSELFSAPELMEVLYKIYELGAKLPEEVEAEKNDLDPNLQETEDGTAQ